MKILITGGAGFLGHHAASRLLAEGHEVVIADGLTRFGSVENADRLGKHPACHFLRIDVRSPKEVEGAIWRSAPDAVLHLAAQVAVTTSLVDPRADFEVNALGTLNVLEAVRKGVGKRPAVVVASTNKVYGDLEGWDFANGPFNGPWIDESYPIDPVTPYACSKSTADCYTRDYARTFGLRTTVLRFSCLYGLAQRGTADQGWISHFVRSVAAGQPITVCGDGRQVRDVLWVDDAVDAMVRAVERIGDPAVCGQAFNVGGGPANTLSVNGLIARLAETFGPLDVRHADARLGDQRCYVSDTRKAERLLGWRPTVGVDEGVRRLIEETRAGQTSS